MSSYTNTYKNQVTPFDGCTMVVFGASGDLSKKKIYPSLYQLYKDKMLPKNFHIVGYSRTEMTTEEFIAKLQAEFHYDDSKFFSYITYISGPYQESESMQSLHDLFKKYSQNRIFYLSLPPSEFRNVCRSLKKSNLITENSGGIEHSKTRIGTQPYSRIAIEKPFGTDTNSAIKLDRFLNQHFKHNQIFVVDHYLGKEPVQNILFFRFANSIFENVWNGKYIQDIQITMEEDITVSKRAGYFDQSGILKDMIQSHGLQLLALTMMEPPISFDAQHIRTEKSKVLSSLQIYSASEVASDVVRGQYEGYLQEDGVAENSKTETLIALKTYVDNWRWSGTPIYLRTGKGLSKRKTEVVITFKAVPHNIFGTEHNLENNRLIFRFQPDTFIKLLMSNKIPGNKTNIISSYLDFPYDIAFKDYNFINGYDRILFSVLMNDATLFLSSDEIYYQWRFTDAILDTWHANHNLPLHRYACGSRGPEAMHELLRRDGYKWNI